MGTFVFVLVMCQQTWFSPCEPGKEIRMEGLTKESCEQAKQDAVKAGRAHTVLCLGKEKG